MQRPVNRPHQEEDTVEAIAMAALGGYHLFSMMQGQPFNGVDQHTFLSTLVELTSPHVGVSTPGAER